MNTVYATEYFKNVLTQKASGGAINKVSIISLTPSGALQVDIADGSSFLLEVSRRK